MITLTLFNGQTVFILVFCTYNYVSNVLDGCTCYSLNKNHVHNIYWAGASWLYQININFKYFIVGLPPTHPL